MKELVCMPLRTEIKCTKLIWVSQLSQSSLLFKQNSMLAGSMLRPVGTGCAFRNFCLLTAIQLLGVCQGFSDEAPELKLPGSISLCDIFSLNVLPWAFSFHVNLFTACFSTSTFCPVMKGRIWLACCPTSPA